MTDFLSLIARLSPSKQRLVRELVWNLAQLERLTVPEDHDARLDYQSHVGPWLESLIARGYSKETIRHHRRQVERLLEVYPHPSQTLIETYLARMITAGREPATVARALETFRGFLGYLAERNITTSNPAAKVPRPQLPHKYRKPATPEQVRAMLEAQASLRHKAMLYLMVDCGLRVNELATALISNIDAQMVTVVGKGSKTRQVPMSSETTQILNAHIGELRSLGYLGDWLFPGREPGAHITTDGVRDFVYRLSVKAGAGRLSPHQLRHYFATSILSQGANLKAVSIMLGHADTSTTVDTYWHILDQKEITDQHAKYSPLKGALCQE